MASVNEIVPYRVLESEQIITSDSRISKPSVSMNSNLILLGTNRKVGYGLPGWRDRLAKKVDASTSYTRVFVDYDQPALVRGSSVNRPNLGYRLESSGRFSIVGMVSPQYTTDTETYNRALAGIKKQLASRVGSAEAMAPLAEMRELSSLVRQMVLLSTNFVIAVGNAKRSRGKSAWKFLTDTWLGYKFGLAPLVSDVGNVGNAIAAYLARNDLSVRLAASASKHGVYSYEPSCSVTGFPMGFQGWKKVARANYNLSYRFVGGFDVALRSSNQYSMLDHLGIGLSQIPATLWELTAFSWMVDYFTNVGSFLSDVFQSAPGQTRYLVCNRRYALEATHEFLLVNGNPIYTGLIVKENIPGHCTVRYVEFQRTPLTKLPHAGLYIKSFDEVGRHGISKLLNLIAVLNR